KFVACRSLIVLLDCHMFWTLVLCFTAIIDHFRTIYKLSFMNVSIFLVYDVCREICTDISQISDFGKPQNDTNNASGCVVNNTIDSINLMFLQGLFMPLFFLRQFRTDRIVSESCKNEYKYSDGRSAHYHSFCCGVSCFVLFSKAQEQSNPNILRTREV
ncbi:hypothetical protein PRIPAC_84936, partial [Pristionchus pacificus]|uniref:Uncharacterized protein n=1 Tax=Pristionchus pacificus TaxID=54126 RepID=A0A2A6BU18_PRIPA